MKVADVCTREVVFADRSASLQQAAALMREHHVGTLLVVANAGEGPQVVGIVTDRDVVVEGVARGLDLQRTEVGRLASDKLAAIPVSATVGEAIAAMKERGVRRLLVAKDGGALYGVVSLDDLLGAVAHEMAELAHAVRVNVERESAERQPLPRPSQPTAVRIPTYAIS